MGQKSNWAEFKKAVGDEDLEEFLKSYYNEMVDTVVFNLKSLSFRNNFQSQVFDKIEIPATSTIKVYHGLGVAPLYRLILGNTGNGAITDGEFTDRYIELRNRGSVAAIVKLVIFKG